MSDDPELLAAWLDETDEQLNELTAALAAWTNDRENASRPAEALRLIHAMEGAAGLLAFEQLLAANRFVGSEVERVQRMASSGATPSPVADLQPLVEILRDCNARLRRGESLESATVLVEKLRAARQQTL